MTSHMLGTKGGGGDISALPNDAALVCVVLHVIGLGEKEPSSAVLPELSYFSMFGVFPHPVRGSKGRGCHMCNVCKSPWRQIMVDESNLID